MANGVSEALKINIFWGSMPLFPPPPPPPRGSLRLQNSFHYALLCVPKRKNHATPLQSIPRYNGHPDNMDTSYNPRQKQITDV